MPSTFQLAERPEEGECVNTPPPPQSPSQPIRFQLECFLPAARPTQPLEPILFPKLRIHYADFPYLHCSIGQRLFTLRPDAVMGTARHETNMVQSDSAFQGLSTAHWTLQ